MSKTTQAALRRAAVRELVRDVDRPAEPDAPEAPDGHYSPQGERVRPSEAATAAAGYYHSLELDTAQRAQLENLAGRYTYAVELLNGLHDDGRISDIAAWNARDALEDDVGRPWPSQIPGADPSLARRLTKLFNAID